MFAQSNPLPGQLFMLFLLGLLGVFAWLVSRSIKGGDFSSMNWRREVALVQNYLPGGGRGARRWHYVAASAFCAVLAYEGMWPLWLVAFLLFIIGQQSATQFYAGRRAQAAVNEHQAAINSVAQAEGERQAAKMFRPPVWPPRRPDDWGHYLQEAHQAEIRRHQRDLANLAALGGNASGIPSPLAPIIPSWEAHHAAEQAKDPLQIRWAQSESGEWVRVVWGDRARPPANGGPLPVYQSVKLESSGRWIWLRLGVNVPLDWQRGAARMQRAKVNGPDGVYYVQRPCGSSSHQDAPETVAPAGEHGDAEWASDDAMAQQGNVRRDA